MTITTRPHPFTSSTLSLSLSARCFYFLFKPNHFFHQCISSYPQNPFFISFLQPRYIWCLLPYQNQTQPKPPCLYQRVTQIQD
ncbi:hypothetical protein PHAVU_009G049700 [Phaseolus vulgaris]|uniref:Uncharacterized protein n=1 Tax=Phaseolus vulgaris TaxID=3885 RepID=V7AT33_PHAVU|nr:hypothetical protein PHAVU_009G049700g [Phaseolus vulgaris]ESW08485.1 hypothetical protein PHAVU_009G049700g [Phaseolus vulgaris]